ncbi:MAG: TlpA disulfide reductase family protein, partial [Candidatus Omnitrophota bacterium]|nr:TlpA disulfide reductase family protein [Candidatus Omnitrophota bacterium]
MKNITFIIIGVLVLIIVAFSLMKPQAVTKKSGPEKGISQQEAVVKKTGFKIAPEFTLKDIGGAEIKLSDFKDKVVIIDFWATWCPPCKAEIPHFIDLYSQYKDQGLEIIGISLDFNGEKILPAFVSKNNINYTILLGGEEVSDLYGGIAAIPTTFI